MRKRNLDKFKKPRISLERKAEILGMNLEERLNHFSSLKEFQLVGHNLPTADQVICGNARHIRVNHADPVHLSKLILDIKETLMAKKAATNPKTPMILMAYYYEEFQYLINRIKNPTIKLLGTTILEELKTE